MENKVADNFNIREATEEDIPLILQLIRELAEYERMLDQVTATEELLVEWLFRRKIAEVIIGELECRPVAFALFFHNFSTFLGRAGVYLEDIYVRPEVRGIGIGKAMLKYIARLAVKRGCGRMEWWCLDWNESSIGFYLSLGAEAMAEWTVYRMSGRELEIMAED